jgi:hypothetical protein
MSSAPPLDDDALMPTPQMQAMLGGVCDMTIWRWRNNPKMNFPKPIVINGRNYWQVGKFRRFIAERAADQSPPTGPPTGPPRKPKLTNAAA